MPETVDVAGTLTLCDVLVDVLEEFAFLFAEPGNALPVVADGDCWAAEVLFSGKDCRGSLKIVMSEALCVETGANVLGVEPEDISSSDAQEAIKELANIVAGAYTAKAYGVNMTFRLEPPMISKASGQDIEMLLSHENIVIVTVDDNWVAAFIEAE